MPQTCDSHFLRNNGLSKNVFIPRWLDGVRLNISDRAANSNNFFLATQSGQELWVDARVLISATGDFRPLQKPFRGSWEFIALASRAPAAIETGPH